MECLITKFKGRVQNDELPKLGIVKVKMASGKNILYHLAIAADNGATVPNYKFHAKVLDDHTYFYVTNKDTHYIGEFTTNSWQLNCVNESETECSTVEINVYDSVVLFGQGYTLEKLPKSENILGLIGDFVPPISSVIPTVYGNLKTIKEKFPNIVAVRLNNCPYVEGDITEAFGECNIYVLDVPFSDKITGSINELASTLVSNGRTSGKLIIEVNNRLTYNGTVVGAGKKATITFNNSVPNGYSVEIS